MKLFDDFKKYISDIFKISNITYLRLFFILILVCIGTTLDILSLGLIIPLISSLFGNETDFLFFPLIKTNKENFFIYLLCLVTFILILRSITVLYIHYLQTKYAQQIVINLRNDILKSFFNQNYLDYKSKKLPDFIYSVNDLSSRFGSIVMNLIKTVSDLIFAIAILIFLSTLELFFIIFFLVGILLWLISYDKIFGVLLKIYGERFNFFIKRIINFATESFLGFKEIIVLNCKKLFMAKVDESSKIYASFQLKHQLIIQLQAQVLEILTGLIIIIAIFYLFISGTEPSLIIAKLGVFAVGIFRLKPIIGTLNKSISDYRFNSDVILILKDNLQDLKKERKITKNDKLFIKKVSFRNIYFSYDIKNNSKLINNINFEIFKKDIIGITGLSGSGKTTFLDIISGLIKPHKGEVSINDNDDEISFQDLKQYIGYIPQDSFIIDSDIKSNVSVEFDDKKIDYNKIKESLKKSGLKEFSNNLNKKVGERGSLLSGGQKQRLIIARHFYKKNQILIFDESTNALDKITEHKIITELIELQDRPILILVNHSLNLKKYCNKVYEINDGILKKIG